MSGVESAIALRPLQPGDDEFLARVYASTREDELAVVPFSDEERAAFIAQQFAAQSAHFAKHYAAADYDVVEVGDTPAGRLIVLRSEARIEIVDIALLPEFRGRGVGSRLIEAILAEADAAAAKVSLHVESFNRALHLYERLGFQAIGTNGVYFEMERSPRARSGEDGLVDGAGAVRPERDQEDLQGPEALMLQPVDLLVEHGLGRPAEGEVERRAHAGRVEGVEARAVGLGIDQLQVKPKGVGMNDENVTDQRGEVVHVEAVEHAGDPNRGMTRRRALQLGAMAGLSTMWAGPSLARAATNSTPIYLRRSSYAGLVGKSFTIDGGSFSLVSVSDLAGATSDAALRGHDEAFVLEFDGAPGALEGGIHNFSHPDVGSFSLFASPVETVEGGKQRYEVVVDRSVGRPADPGEAPGPVAQTSAAEKEAAAEKLLAETPIEDIPGAPKPAKPARKRRAKRRHRHVKAKRTTARKPVKARKPVHGKRRRSKRRK